MKLTALLLGSLAVTWFFDQFAMQPFQVVNDNGHCLYEMHPGSFIWGTEDEKKDCGTTGELVLATPVNIRHMR